MTPLSAVWGFSHEVGAPRQDTLMNVSHIFLLFQKKASLLKAGMGISQGKGPIPIWLLGLSSSLMEKLDLKSK
jgi:hypothetical protein